MTYYKLFLTKDSRTDISYNHFIGGVWSLLTTTDIKKVKLWEDCSKNILQGDMKIKEWFDGFQSQTDFILIGCGFSPNNEAQVEPNSYGN